MNESPVMVVLYLGVAGYVASMYYSDWKAAKAGQVLSSAMPGAFSARPMAFIIGLLGALGILALETGGEIALGVVSEQSEMVWFFVFASLAAGIVEEVIFRGYLIDLMAQQKGRFILIGSCLVLSLAFALLHPHLWSMEDGFELTLTSKGFFSTGILFLNSLWFYAVRFGPWNPSGSIFPCMLAHAGSNLGVFFVKLAQGYVVF